MSWLNALFVSRDHLDMILTRRLIGQLSKWELTEW